MKNETAAIHGRRFSEEAAGGSRVLSQRKHSSAECWDGVLTFQIPVSGFPSVFWFQICALKQLDGSRDSSRKNLEISLLHLRKGWLIDKMHTGGMETT